MVIAIATCRTDKSLLTTRENGSLRMSRSVLFWYLRISRSATVPGLNRFSVQRPSVQHTRVTETTIRVGNGRNTHCGVGHRPLDPVRLRHHWRDDPYPHSRVPRRCRVVAAHPYSCVQLLYVGVSLVEVAMRAENRLLVVCAFLAGRSAPFRMGV